MRNVSSIICDLRESYLSHLGNFRAPFCRIGSRVNTLQIQTPNHFFSEEIIPGSLIMSASQAYFQVID